MQESDVWRIAQSLMPPDAWKDDAFHSPISPSLKRVYSMDTFVEGTHFNPQWQSWRSIGWRCLSASLSDLAACGAKPLGFLIGLTLPIAVEPEAVTSFYQGLEDACQALSPGLKLWGGDTTGGKAWVVSITVIGEASTTVSLKRQEAQVGNLVLTTGHHGLSGLGCWLLNQKADTRAFPEALNAFKRPMAQIEAGLTLAHYIPTASLMDTSDGLADAALQCGKASQVQVVLDATRIPLHAELQHAQRLFPTVKALDLLRYGGEDFQLLATVPPSAWETHHTALEAVGFFPIGEIKALPLVPLSPQSALPLSSYATWQDLQGHCVALDPTQRFQHFDVSSHLKDLP